MSMYCRWFDEGEDDGLIEREIPLTRVIDDGHSDAPPPQDGDWHVFITSGSPESRGSTDAQVFWQVFGEKGDTGELPLGQPGKGLFEAGNTDQFDVSNLNITPIDKDPVEKLCKVYKC